MFKINVDTSPSAARRLFTFAETASGKYGCLFERIDDPGRFYVVFAGSTTSMGRMVLCVRPNSDDFDLVSPDPQFWVPLGPIFTRSDARVTMKFDNWTD